MLKGDALLKVASGSTSLSHIAPFNVGDTVVVQVKVKEGDKERLQAFKGVVIAIDGKGANRTFTVRKISANNVGVERVFLFTSPAIESVTRVAVGKVRRAKLYYLRQLSGRKARVKQDFLAAFADEKATSTDSQSPSVP